MKLLSESPPARGPRRRLGVFAILVGVLFLAGVAYWRIPRPASRRPEASPPATPRNQPSPRAERADAGSVEVTADVEGALVFVDGTLAGPAPQRVDGLASGSHRVRVEKAGLPAYLLDAHVIPRRVTRVQARLAAAEPDRVLKVTSDVPEASVFLDRKFVGRTPVSIEDLAPGSHRLNVSAEGYEMYAETLEVTAGTREVLVRFKEVRLQESLEVVHQHALGSCQGSLVAAVEGLRYQTAKQDDAFFVPLAGIEELSVEYLKSSLRLKVHGGRSYKFSASSADALLSFQKKVEAARRRLAAS